MCERKDKDEVGADSVQTISPYAIHRILTFFTMQYTDICTEGRRRHLVLRAKHVIQNSQNCAEILLVYHKKYMSRTV